MMDRPEIHAPAETDWSALGEPMAPGVYFDMPTDQYRAAGAGSSSLFKDLAVSPLTAWVKHINPERKDEATDAQDHGTALHKRILEGDEAFLEHCAVIPENDGEYLEGVAELKARCKELGLKVGGNTADLCERIKGADPDAKLWPEVMAQFHAEHGDKILLKASVWQEMELPARFIHLHPYAGKAFDGGYPEVSIFWGDPETGMPLKCRVDYLKIKAAVDLKYFANIMQMPIDRAVARAIANEQHHVQARHYLDGVAAAKKLVKAGKVFGDNPPPADWLDAFAASPAPHFIWVFIQKGNVPEVRVVEFAQFADGAKEGAMENAYYTDSTKRLEDAKSLLKLCVETYGVDPWIDPKPARALQDTDLPMWLMEGSHA